MTQTRPAPARTAPDQRAPSAGTTPGETAVATHGLTIGFGATPVLSDVSLTFPQGSITALIGPTGTGKSTFLRSLNRMNDRMPSYRRSGDVTLEGTSIFGSRVQLMSLRRRVGMVFQQPNPFPMSIADNVASGVKAHRLADRAGRKRIAEARLREVGLWDAVADRLGDSPFRLSGGQQQLLCLARALAIGPDVLLLDEPTSSLDPVTVQAVEDLLRGLTPALTLILVTHNLAQARRVAHFTAFLNGGRLVEHGPTAELFDHPGTEETANYVSGRMG
ncbi:MAG TPA: phosphate ABC transporter ATP-binding protein [Acidimicrobiales bacterium]|nr:phosphate ABC transporter ATP-binding protein [Acidimicrobiales bacterium]